MFIATTTSDTQASSVGAALPGIFAPTDRRQWPSERESMPLRRSLADRATRVAINIALLTELFASPPPPFRLANDACKERGHSCPMPLALDTPHPEGMNDNSPAFRRWDSAPEGVLVPQGRLKPAASAVPAGLRQSPISVPNVETLGYCRMSLRDKHLSRAHGHSGRSNPSGIGHSCPLVGRALEKVHAARHGSNSSASPPGVPARCSKHTLPTTLREPISMWTLGLTCVQRRTRMSALQPTSDRRRKNVSLKVLQSMICSQTSPPPTAPAKPTPDPAALLASIIRHADANYGRQDWLALGLHWRMGTPKAPKATQTETISVKRQPATPIAC